MILYVDSNIFISAILDERSIGKDCSKVLEMITDRRILCASSLLTMDEVLYVLRKKTSKDDSIRYVKSFFTMPIRWIEVDRATVIGMLEAVEKEDLKPRDAIHLSTMRMQGIDTILTEDTDFDGIEGIKRISPSDLIRETKE
jgi:predicted nucleic acid-binding protein